MFLKYIFVVFLVPFSFLYFFNIFLVIKLSVSFSCHLVFKWRRDSNPRIKTMTKNLTSGGFHQHYMNSFYTRRSKKRIKTVKSSVILRFWDHARKSSGKKCKENRPLETSLTVIIIVIIFKIHFWFHLIIRNKFEPWFCWTGC